MAILTTHDMAVGYGQGNKRTILLSDLNLRLEQGSLVALLGKNGAGKSTLLRALTCDSQPINGSVEIDGKPSDEISKRDLSRLIALVATERIMGGAFTIRELVALGRQPHTGFLGRLSRHDDEVVRQSLEAVGIAHKAEQHVAQLSDGERQKAMIAKALAQETPIIVLDEPTAFLDVASRIETMKLLHSLAREQNKAVLLSSHDISQSLLLADELWVIIQDREVVTGSTEQVVMSGAMDRVFDNSSILFNNDLCDYESKLPTTASVMLECDDSKLEHCVANALLRNGIDTSHGGDVTVKVLSVNDFKLPAGKVATSVKELVKLLRDMAIK
ncbi:MAG: ABC transporter ATP-binding protein [Bacteroidales bacterium]|nr:ABC transporter ATP-binding protein [Muribaculaceae bacterium]MDY6412055.1 ABC transporter ATP-binding protein [Bacteroidales bacterium]